jgi:hypothetical protein
MVRDLLLCPDRGGELNGFAEKARSGSGGAVIFVEAWGSARSLECLRERGSI